MGQPVDQDDGCSWRRPELGPARGGRGPQRGARRPRKVTIQTSADVSLCVNATRCAALKLAAKQQSRVNALMAAKEITFTINLGVGNYHDRMALAATATYSRRVHRDQRRLHHLTSNTMAPENPTKLAGRCLLGYDQDHLLRVAMPIGGIGTGTISLEAGRKPPGF